MPLNVRRFYISILLVLTSLVTLSLAQTTATPSNIVTAQQAPVMAPTSGDVMRGRISKAKAFIAVRNYNAAIYELENIRKETGDAAVQSVVNVLLMNSYLEQGDYKRAQDFLGESYNLQKTTKPGAATNYMAIAGQIVKGARGRAERYKALGLSINDRTLPLEALNDLEKMRETVELVITHSKEIGKTPARTGDAMALLEEATQSRSMIARDDYDAKRWRDEVADTREVMANSRTVVLSAVNGENVAVPADLVAENKPAPPPITQPQYTPAVVAAKTDAATSNTAASIAPANNTPAKPAGDAPVYVPAPQQPVIEKPKPTVEEPKPAIQEAKPAVEDPKPAKPAEDDSKPKYQIQKPVSTEPVASAETADSSSPLDVGSLLSYATLQPPPIYPAMAKSMRTTGTVRVDVTVDEKGDVAQVGKLTGPVVLQGAAKEAIKRWKFKPFTRDGQPVKATGFVSFNFNL